MILVVISAVTMLLLAILMAVILGWAKQAFHVDIDPRVEKIIEALPDANCGACGYAGCADYAEAVAAGKADIMLCPVGGESCAAELAEIMGIEVGAVIPDRPIVKCGAREHQRKQRHAYIGERTCKASTNVAGVQGCTFGCLGFGDCVVACDYDAIHIIDGLAVVDYAKCIGCAACARACPRLIIEMVAFQSDDVIKVACSNHDDGKTVKAVCEVGCIGCSKCGKMSEVFKIDDNLASVDYEEFYKDKLEESQEAARSCPTNCIVMTGKSWPADSQVETPQPAES